MESNAVATPRVTIVIPVYNGSNFLREAIDSALSQTYPNIEIVVVNDGSRDNGATERIAMSYGDRIRFYSKENGGVASALNFAVGKMTGEYFSWLSHDDLYTDDKVEKDLAALAQTGSDRSIIYSDYSVFTNNPADAIARRLEHVPPQSFRYWLTVESGLHGCTLLIPRFAFEKIGVFNEGLRTTQDMDLWFRMASEYSFVHIPEVLVKSRFHDAQGSRVMSSIARTECDNLYSAFIREMGTQEIGFATGLPLADSYGRIASRMFSLGLNHAAMLAESYARRYDPNKIALVTRNVGYLKNRIAHMLRALLPAGIFVHIKLIIYRMKKLKAQ